MNKNVSTIIHQFIILIIIIGVFAFVWTSIKQDPSVRHSLIGTAGLIEIEPFKPIFTAELTDIDRSAGGFLTPTKYVMEFNNSKKLIASCCDHYTTGDIFACELYMKDWTCINVKELKQ